MPTRFETPRLALLTVVIAGVLFLSVNILGNLWLAPWRIDATQGGAFTISDQIKPVFASIDEPITVRLYFSEALGQASPRHAALYRRVRELLEQYARLAKGKLNIIYENPEPFSDTEDRALGFGLQGVPLGREGEVGYFGLAATNATDDQKVIPFFNLEREQFVEYDLTKLIYSLSKPNQSKIGIISSLPLEGGMGGMQFGMQGQPTPPWAIMQQITDLFDVKQLDANVREIPADIGMLLLAQPDNLSPAAQYAIDQFVLRGGKVLAFVDPNPESGGTPGGANLEGIKKLMKAWGVAIADNKVVGDLDHAVRVNSEANGRPIVSDYVAWLQLGPGNLDPNDAVTGDLKQITFGTPGAIEKVDGATTTITPLITTGPRSMRIDTDKVQGLPDVVALFRDFKPSNQREVLAARITGPVKTAFPDGPPKADKPEDGKPDAAKDKAEAKPDAKPAEQLKDSKQPVQIVLVADSDVLADRFWVQESQFFGQRVAVPTSDNAGLVVNALENLTGSPALSSLRGRGAQNRPFTLIESIRRDAERDYRAKEQALLNRLDELQKKVNAIQLRQGDNDQIQLSAQDRTAIENYRSEILSTRRELRDVQRALRQDIDRLEGIVKFINIAAVPIIFGIVTIVIGALRRRRRAAAAAVAG